MTDYESIIPRYHTRPVAPKAKVDVRDFGPPPMIQEENRRCSFNGWSSVSYSSVDKLVQAGFYYTQLDDIVKCAFCSLELGNWQPGDDPVADHKKWAPSCSFVKQLTNTAAATTTTTSIAATGMPANSNRSEVEEPNGADTCGKYGIELRPYSYGERETPAVNLSKLGVQTSKPAFPQYTTLESRLATFAEWPKAIKQRPAALAEAGFYYLGKGDQVICFFCKGGLKDWEPEDDPWEQHTRWFSMCSHVRSHKSPEYISRVCSTQSCVLTAEQAQSLTNVPNNASTSTDERKPASAPKDVEGKPTKERDTSPNNKATSCKICYEKEVGVVFLPCGHMVACVDCAPSIENCAVCRKPLQATVRAFLS